MARLAETIVTLVARRALALTALVPFFGACSDDTDSVGATGGAGGAIDGSTTSLVSSHSSGGGTTSTGGVNAATEEDLTVLEPLAAITEAVQANADVWPGYTFMSMPIVPVNSGERALVVKHPAPPSGLPPLEGVPGEMAEVLGTTYLGVGYEGLLQPGEPFRFFADLGDGSSAFAFGYPFAEKVLQQSVPAPIEEMITAMVVVHEMFHMYQQEHWTTDPTSELCAFPLDDDELLALSRVEHLALNAALEAVDPTEATEDFLVARLVRHASAPTIKDEEDYWETIEGMATFAEGYYMEAAGYTGDPTVQWASDLIAPFDVAELGRSRHYQTGAALAALLDGAGIAFREELAAGGRLTDIAAAAFGMDGPAAQARLPELLQRYDVEASIMPEVAQAKADYIAARDAAVAAVEAAPGPLVVFDFTQAGALTSAGWYTLEDCTTYYVDTSFYMTAPMLEASILDKAVRQTPATLELAFRSLSEAPFMLNGAQQDWVPGPYPFESLTITFDDWAVDTSLPGTLVIAEDEVRISITQE